MNIITQWQLLVFGFLRKEIMKHTYVFLHDNICINCFPNFKLFLFTSVLWFHVMHRCEFVYFH